MATPITLDQLLDIIDEGSPDQRLALAQKLAPMFLPQISEELRSGNLQDAVANMWPRITVNDADVVEDSAGTEVWGGPSRFAVMDFPGATAWIDDDDRNTVHIRAAGGGADCAYDYIVSSCFSSLDGFTEGMTLYSISGCPFKGYSTLTLVSADIDANGAAGGAYSTLLCGITTESVTISPGSKKLFFYGSGREHSGITGTLTVSTMSSAAILEFYDLSLPALTAGDENAYCVAHRCAISTLTSVTTSGWLEARFYDCTIDTVVSSSLSNWGTCLWQGCNLSTFDLSLGVGSTPHGGIRIIDCQFPTTGTIKIESGGHNQIIDNIWSGSGTATTPIVFIVGSSSFGDIIKGNKLPAPPTGGAAIAWTGAGLWGADIIGNTFPYGGQTTINFVRGTTGAAIVNVTGNSFEPRDATPTYLEDDVGISISGKFHDSTFGPNTPADFDLELLSGSSGNLYIGLGTVSGAGASGVTIIPGGLAPNTGKFLTYADDFANLPSSEIWTPGSGLQGSGTPGSTYDAKLGDLTEDWTQGGVFDILTAGRISIGNNTTPFDITMNAAVINAEQAVHIDGISRQAGLLFTQHSGTAPTVVGPVIYLAKTRGTWVTPTINASGDILGAVHFLGWDGVDYAPGASIRAFVDGTPGSDDMPARLGFYTTPDASNAPIERIRITNAGGIWIANYLRVGSLVAPTNTTDGDLTATRLIVPDATLLTGLISQLGGPVGIPNQGELRFYDSGSSNYVGFKADAARTTDLVYVLPAPDPTVGQVLSASAPVAGVVTLSWADDATGAGAVATDAIWDAPGDLVQGTGADTAAVLSAPSPSEAANTTPSAFTNWASQAGNARKVPFIDPVTGLIEWDYITAIDVLTPAQVLTFTCTPAGGTSGNGLVASSGTDVPTFAMTYQGTCTAATIDIQSHTYGGGRSPEVAGGDYPATVLTPFTSLVAPAINRGQAVAESVTFRITATIDGQTKTKDVTVTYYNLRLWGISTEADIDTDAEIDTFYAAQSSEISSSRVKTFTVTAGAGEYIYYMIRSALGTPTFTVGGFEGGFQLVGDDVSFSNTRSFTENYDVWRSDLANLGSTTVVVT